MEHGRFHFSPEIIKKMNNGRWHVVEVILETPHTKDIYINGEKYEAWKHARKYK